MRSKAKMRLVTWFSWITGSAPQAVSITRWRVVGRRPQMVSQNGSSDRITTGRRRRRQSSTSARGASSTSSEWAKT